MRKQVILWTYLTSKYNKKERMGATKSTLTKLFLLAAITGLISPSFYANAVDAESNRSAEASQKGQEQSGQSPQVPANNDNPVARAARMKTACNKVRTSISNRTAHFQQMGDRHLSVIDKVYDSLTTFANDNSLSMPAEDTAIVLSARETARIAILNLASTEDTLNCEDTNASQSAAALRIQIQSVSNTLHSYRKAVGAVLTTLKAEVQKDTAE